MPGLTTTLASFVPALVRRHLIAHPQPPTAPAVEHFPAAALFADISGFTALTERLARRGPEGAEELSTVLNAYFGPLIALITAHGGDVVKFAGDALLALWRADTLPDDPALATRRATQCALALQQLHAAPELDIRLSLKVCVAAGEVVASHLGGVFGRWDVLVAGTPLVELGFAGHQAGPDEVVLAPSAWALLCDVAEGHSLHDGVIRVDRLHAPLPLQPLEVPSLSQEARAALRAYIPGAILARLTAGQEAWLAELRRVTTLFINLPALNHTSALEHTQSIIRALQGTVYRYEGSINKISVDDKGSTLVAAFGLPPLAHEDDAVRGVQAALAAYAALHEMGLDCAIGVTTDRVFCGVVGSDQRREYTLLGAAVNLAARLMQAAGHHERDHEHAGSDAHSAPLLCDAATFQVAQSHITFEPLPAITVKGVAKAVAIYRPLGVTQKSIRPRTALVGREAERAILGDQVQSLLRGMWDQEHTGAAGLVIEGEAGIGKSRLIDDLVDQARACGLTALVGAGDGVERATPYYVWRSIFSQLLDLDTLSDPADRRRQLLMLLQDQPDLLRFMPLLNPVLLLEIPDNEITAQMSGALRAENTRELMVRLLENAARRTPLVLVLEDAHWLDSASWALALAISRRLRPALLAIGTRPLGNTGAAPAQAEYQELLQSPETHRLVLAPLPRSETLALVCQRLGVVTLPDPVAQLILKKAHGNPFFSEELAYALRDAGVIQISDGVCRLAPTAGDLQALDFPDTIQGVITSRIDQLTPSQQLTLKVASVIGRVFEFRILRDIYPIDATFAYLADDLTTLEQLDLTELETTEPDLTHLFKHIITHEVTYNMMLFAQRRALHQAIAEWYERTQSGDLSPFAPLLAHHWTQAISDTGSGADMVLKAVRYLSLAGEQSLRISAFREAVGFFDQALRLAQGLQDLAAPEAPGWRTMLSCQLGEAHMMLGDYAMARERLETSLALADAHGDQRAMASALSRLGRVARDQGAYAEAHERLEASLALARAANDRAILAYVLSNLGLVALYQGRLVEAREHLEEGLEVARAIDDRVRMGSCLSNLGIVGLMSHDYSEARQHFEEALAISSAIGDRRVMSNALGNLGNVADALGEYAEARGRFEEALALNRQIGYQPGIAILLNNLGKVTLALGDTAMARQFLHEGLRLDLAIGMVPAALYALIVMARLVAHEGATEQAVELVGLVLHHPASDSEIKDEAEAFLAELQDTIPAAVLEAAQKQGRALGLEQAVAEILDYS